jgi:cob(I)alamin adenosyltransferase
MTKKNSRGLIHVYTGNGKGKTTAALGLAVRAAGHNRKVVFIQFIKGISTGELLFVKKYKAFDIVRTSTGNALKKQDEQLRNEAQKTLAYAGKAITDGNYDLIVLDEICFALHRGLLDIGQVLELLDNKPDNLELVLTGRNAPKELIERADLVTEMSLIKHPYNEGIAARKGIEY